MIMSLVVTYTEVSLHLLNYPRCADNCSHLVDDGGRSITFLTLYM